MAFWNAFVLRVIPSPTAPNSVILTLWGRTSFMFICLQIELLHTVHVLLLNNASTKSTSTSCKRNVSPSPSVRSILIAENNIDFYKTMNRAVHMASSTATREGSFFLVCGGWGIQRHWPTQHTSISWNYRAMENWMKIFKLMSSKSSQMSYIYREDENLKYQERYKQTLTNELSFKQEW